MAKKKKKLDFNVLKRFIGLRFAKVNELGGGKLKAEVKIVESYNEDGFVFNNGDLVKFSELKTSPEWKFLVHKEGNRYYALPAKSVLHTKSLGGNRFSVLTKEYLEIEIGRQLS